MKKFELITHMIIICTFIFMCFFTFLIKRESEVAMLFTIQYTLVLFVFYFLSFWTLKRLIQSKSSKKEILISGLIVMVSFLIFEIIEAIALKNDMYERYYRVSSIWSNLYNHDFIYIEHVRIVLTFIFVIIAAVIYSFFKYKDYSLKLKRIAGLSLSIISISLCVFIIVLLLRDNYLTGKFQNTKYENDTKIEQSLLQSEKFANLHDIFNYYSLNDRPTLVIFWTNGCSSIKYEISELEKLKKEIEPLKLNFLYINGEYKGKDEDIKRVADFIKSDSISGYHVYLTRNKFHKILVDDYGKNKGVYNAEGMLFDKNMRLLRTNMPRPHKKNELKDTLYKYFNK